MNVKKRQHDYNKLKDIPFGEHEIRTGLENGRILLSRVYNHSLCPSIKLVKFQSVKIYNLILGGKYA
jgi:hypothetical protein